MVCRLAADRGCSPEPCKALDIDDPEDIWTPIQAVCMQFCIDLLNQWASVPSNPSGIIHCSQPRRYGSSRSFADWGTQQIDSFIVRGTRGSMQRMLDLRMYGLKVHYNTTPPGNIT